MSRTRIKICGMKTLDAVHAAIEAGADAIGLVFVAHSPRHVEIEKAQEIVRSLPPFVEAVGLFVDEPVQVVQQTAQTVGLHTVQLHGREGPGYVQRLKKLRVIKALAFEAGFAAERLATWKRGAACVSALLWDTPPPPQYSLTGGSGEVFDWNALAQMREQGLLQDTPSLVLAGGLTPENVGEAMRIVRPYAVDVSSGVESMRGVKDTGLIKAFCQAVHEADRSLAAL